MSNHLTRILLVGTGPMAIAYAKVLISCGLHFDVIGRGVKSAVDFEQKVGVIPYTGGLEAFIEFQDLSLYSHAIVATGTEVLSHCLKLLIANELVNILVEKPAALSIDELNASSHMYIPHAENIFVAYNRRFYASVFVAQKLILEDGGLQAISFEFTEWTHKIDVHTKRPEVLKNWFFVNSTHVVDLAFFLAGEPMHWSAYSKSGEIDWHEKTLFSGAGITKNGVLFSYLSNWESAGRWGIELLTNKRKIILRPLENIFIQERGSVNISPYLFDDSIDKLYKPGLFLQVKSFIDGSTERLLDIKSHHEFSREVYRSILK